MSTRLSIPLYALLAGCAPHNAELLEGEYFAFISENTSFSLQKEAIDPYRWGDDMWTIDCRDFSAMTPQQRNALQLSGIDDECEEGSTDEKCIDRRLGKACQDWIEIDPNEIPVRKRPVHETMLGQSPWWVLHEQLEPWRGEAVITGEGDVQIGFHHRVPGGGDFRWAFVVDPDFAPKKCDIATGLPETVDGDWISEWTASVAESIADTKGMEHMVDFAANGSVFLLNADGFQFNPEETTDFWFLPEQWEAGYAQGKFVEEDVTLRSPRWGTNEAYEFFEVYDPYEGSASPITAADLYYCALEEDENPRDNSCVDGKTADLEAAISSIQTDLRRAMTPEGVDPPVDWSPISHNNFWRPSDGSAAGFDGWQEFHYNVVAFDKTPEEMAALQPGDSLGGAFTLVLDGVDSNSKVYLRGTFNVPKLRKDHWTSADIRAEKLEENGNQLCVLE